MLGRQMPVTMVATAAASIAAAARGQLVAQVKTDDLGWQLTPPVFGPLYDELTKRR